MFCDTTNLSVKNNPIGVILTNKGPTIKLNTIVYKLVNNTMLIIWNYYLKYEVYRRKHQTNNNIDTLQEDDSE